MNNSIGFRGEASLQYKETSRSLAFHRNYNVDERLSTMAAERSLLEADVSRQRERKL